MLFKRKALNPVPGLRYCLTYFFPHLAKLLRRLVDVGEGGSQVAQLHLEPVTDSYLREMSALGSHAGFVGYGEHYNNRFVNQSMTCVVFE